MIPLWIFYINYLCKAKYFLMFSFTFFPIVATKGSYGQGRGKNNLKGGQVGVLK